ncbi:alpha/beta hydrolase [Massilia sp. RP-1-19]|uniref:Alpha/beta hydrolase n=1 Tax=Massilia polaris TaxID=2728846 RepID=A0A848HI90_9BURK|nr:alpha/beta hydrolase [Massilia polaris]NML59761.1 alpha/beta hydrolase [Massilia polaris]
MPINDAGLRIQSDGQGTPFVWGHGLMSSIEVEDALGWFGWDEKPDSVRLIRYDARGHGDSGAARGTDNYHWRHLGADMLAVADAMNSPRFIAGGMSMGCASAIHAAAQAPERIKGLVLAMPPMIWENRSAQREMYQRIARRGVDADGRAMAKLMSRDLARALPQWLLDASPAVAASLAIGVRALDRRIIPDLFHGAANSDLPPRASLHALAQVPTLILAWTGDSTHPLQSAQELHRLLPNSALHVAASHEEFLQFPDHILAFAASLAMPDL